MRVRPVPAAVRLSLALLIAAALIPLSGGAYAADEGILVTETRQEVIFPDGVRLSVAAESESEIVEVKVFFRAAGSGTWGYAYADFRPGPRIVGRHEVPGRPDVYLAPGVEVEYYFLIRDAMGNAVQTERGAVEYLDPRFDWRRVQIGPLELVYHDIDDARIANAAPELAADLRRVSELLQWDDFAGFKGVIYNRYADANAAFPVQSQATTDQGTFGGYAFPAQGVFVGQGLGRRIIVHESAHLMLRDALGDKALNLPSWLDEGFASYCEPEARIQSGARLADSTPPLRAMGRVSGTPETIPRFYQKAVSVFAYLLEQHGPDNFQRLLSQLRAGRNIETALWQVYGFGVEGLDARWAGRPAPPAATPAPTPTATPAPTVTPAPTYTYTPTYTPPPATPRPAATAPTSSLENGELPTPPATPAVMAPATARPVIVTPERIVAVAPSPPPSRPAPAATPPPDGRLPAFVWYMDVWLLLAVALLAAVALGWRIVHTRRRRGRESGGDGMAE